MSGTKHCPNHPSEPATRRGLCKSCYNIYANRVWRGSATWQQLEAEGFVLPPQPRGRGPRQLKKVR